MLDSKGKVRVAGLDPSMRNLGMVRGVLDITSSTFFPEQIALVETVSSPKNKTVRKNSQDLQRARELYIGMHTFLQDVDLVFVEIPVGSQSARAMASYGICIGLLASIDTAMFQVTPTEIKVTACNSKTATKDMMIKWAVNKHPGLDWFSHKSKGVIKYSNKNEHIADAIGAVHAGLVSDQYKELMAMHKHIK